MKIKNITIENFRSYYGFTTLSLSPHLTLFIGANGDGKTTLFEALQWVFDLESDDTQRASLVAGRLLASLTYNQQATIRVTVSLSQQGKFFQLEKGFTITKNALGEVQYGEVWHKACRQQADGETPFSPRELLEDERLFPTLIKKYCFFKGEAELNIFRDKYTLRTLIELFSNVRDFAPYLQFLQNAESKAKQARFNAQTGNKKNEQQTTALHAAIAEAEQQESRLAQQIREAQAQYDKAKEWLKDCESSAQLLGKLHAAEDQVSALDRQQQDLAKRLCPNYTQSLLDELWVVSGMRPVLDSFSRKMSQLKDEKQKALNEQLASISSRKTSQLNQRRLTDALDSLDWASLGAPVLRSLVATQRCPLCRQDAPKGSKAHEYIKMQLLDAIRPKKEEEEKSVAQQVVENLPPLFPHTYIDQLYQVSLSLDALDEVNTIGSNMTATLAQDQQTLAQIDALHTTRQQAQAEVERLSVHVSTMTNLSEKDSLWEAIKEKNKEKEEARALVDDLNRQRNDVLADLAHQQKQLALLPQTAKQQGYEQFYQFVRRTLAAVEHHRTHTYDDLVTQLETKAAEFLALLNQRDFTGVLRLARDGEFVRPLLKDDHDSLIEHPNASLLTTLYISLLLAIADLTRQRWQSEYPLLFDAPTSTFDQGKDSDFYLCLASHVDKQCIVFTKSYLMPDEAGHFSPQLPQIKHLIDNAARHQRPCQVYYLQKTDGLIKTDLSTVSTEVSTLFQ